MNGRAGTLWRTLSDNYYGRRRITIVALLIVCGALALVTLVLIELEQ
jgi:hypothetical protein